MAIAETEPVPTTFGESFLSVDESEATSADFQAPKKENRWCLVELPKEMVEALESGQQFHIKEHSMLGNAALCTDSETWALEFLENSNPMYLGSVAELSTAGDAGKAAEVATEAENKDPNAAVEGDPDAAKKTATTPKACTIFAQCRGHILLKPLSADAQRVRDLLVPHSIDTESGTEVTLGGGTSASSEPLTTSQIQFQVAASPKELQKLLEQGPYVERDGTWCWLPAAFEREVTDVSLNLISLNNWDAAKVDIKNLLKEVQKHFGDINYVPSEAVLLNALRGVVADPEAAPPAPVDEKKSEDTAGKAAESSAAETKAAPVEKGKVKFDTGKIKLFQAMQLLRESPARLRDRFDLPAVAPRPKRARLGTAAPAGASREGVLQIEEFCGAFSALTGTETGIDDLSKIVGDYMYIDKWTEQSIHLTSRRFLQSQRSASRDSLSSVATGSPIDLHR
jgi:hypothetical protein